MRVPLIRLGLTVIVGAVFVSVMNFYLGIGFQMGDLASEDISTEHGDLLVHFRDNFLFAGTIPSIIFWLGIALCIAGIVKRVAFGGKHRPR